MLRVFIHYTTGRFTNTFHLHKLDFGIKKYCWQCLLFKSSLQTDGCKTIRSIFDLTVVKIQKFKPQFGETTPEILVLPKGFKSLLF